MKKYNHAVTISFAFDSDYTDIALGQALYDGDGESWDEVMTALRKRLVDVRESNDAEAFDFWDTAKNESGVNQTG